MRARPAARHAYSFLLGLLSAAIVIAPAAHADVAAPCMPADASVPAPAAEPAVVTPLPDPAPASEQPAAAPAPAGAWPPLVITELLPDPAGDDASEFIEIGNAGMEAVPLAGWTLADGKGKLFALPDATLPAESVRYFAYAESGLRLVNAGGTLTLRDPAGAPRDAVTYASPVPTGRSYARIAGAWAWAAPTPGQENPDVQPEPAVSASTASMTTAAAATAATTTPSAATAATPAAVTPPAEPARSDLPLSLVAVLPNPDGADDGEWIEIRNAGAAAVTPVAWRVTDASGAAYALGGEAVPAGAALRLLKSVTRISLNNDGDSVSLLSPDGMTRSAVTYGAAPSGEVYRLAPDGTWRWDGDAGGAGAAAAVTTRDDAADAGATGATDANAAGTTDAASAAATTGPLPDPDGLAALDALRDGDPTVVDAVVTLSPGVLGKTTFAVRDATEDVGAVVRMYGRGPFPMLAPGTVVRIVGHVRKTGAARLATTAKGVRALGKARVPRPPVLAPGEITAEDAGLQATVHGIVSGRGKKWIAVSDETASAEVTARVAAGDVPDASEGDEVTLTGVVRSVGERLELVLADATSIRVASAAERGANSAAGANADGADTPDAAAAGADAKPAVTARPAAPESTPWAVPAIALLTLASGVAALRRKRAKEHK